MHTLLSCGIWWEPWLWSTPGLSGFGLGVYSVYGAIVFPQNPGRALLCKHAWIVLASQSGCPNPDSAAARTSASAEVNR